MAASPDEAASLDDEIAELKEKAEALRSELKIQVSTLLSSASAQQLLSAHAGSLPSQASDDHITPSPTPHDLLAHFAAQQSHNQQSLYRACASVTTFRVRDPDPRAVDGGTVLGIRLEVMRRGRFLRPYYVLLNRPYGADARQHLRVHRHTVPPAVPLAGLAARYLPPPSSAAAAQDLSRFVRTLRRLLVRYHNRMAAVADLRRAAGLGRPAADGEEGSGAGLVDISPADTEARQIKVEWADGRAGRLMLDEDGGVEKLVVFGELGRDRTTEREFLGSASRLEDITKRLLSQKGGSISPR